MANDFQTESLFDALVDCVEKARQGIETERIVSFDDLLSLHDAGSVLREAFAASELHQVATSITELFVDYLDIRAEIKYDTDREHFVISIGRRL